MNEINCLAQFSRIVSLLFFVNDIHRQRGERVKRERKRGENEGLFNECGKRKYVIAFLRVYNFPYKHGPEMFKR